MSIRRLYDVGNILYTPYRRWNDIVCLLGNMLAFESQFETFRISCSFLEIFRWSYSIIFKSDEIITSISTRGRVHFWIHLVNRKLIGRKTWLTNRCRNGNICIICWTESYIQTIFNLTKLSQLLKNKHWWFYSFLFFSHFPRGTLRQLKKVNTI